MVLQFPEIDVVNLNAFLRLRKNDISNSILYLKGSRSITSKREAAVREAAAATAVAEGARPQKVSI